MTFIRITEAEATALRGPVGDYHALDPIALPDTDDYILTDEVLTHPAYASAVPTLEVLPTYAEWQTGVAYAANDIVAHEAKLWRIVQAHTSQADWEPQDVPALWRTAHEAGVIPEWVQPQGAHDAYALGARVTHNGQVWESTINANVWPPGTGSLWTVVT